jgi:putative MATE family efflux protein
MEQHDTMDRQFFRDFFKDKAFFLQFVRILLPMAGQNLIMVGISMADTMMVGRLGDVQLSSVALANQLGFIQQLLLFGLSSGANVLIAQYWGKRDVQSIHKVMTIMYRVLSVATLVFTILALFFSRQVLSIFTTDPSVIETGASFLRIVGLGYIIHCFGASSMMVMRSVGVVKISLAVYLASFFTNIFFNWVLIFGNLGAPALGVEGAAIATVMSRVAEIVIVLIYMVRYEKLIRYRLHMFFAKRLGILRSFIRNALPVVINEFLWGIGASAIAVIVGRMGTEFTAANSICSVMIQLVSISIFGAGNASAVIIGNTVGSGRYELAKERALKLIVLSFCLGLLAMTLMLSLKRPMLMLYNISDVAKVYANQMMTIYAFLAVFQAFSMVSLVGVLRGGGDGRFVAYVDVLSMWLIAIPLGFLSGHVWGWAVPAVYAMLKCDEVVKTLVTLPRLLGGKWVRDVTKETEAAAEATD